MSLTQRQESILNSIIGEYIDKAKPVSSRFLEIKYGFGVCPATIRNEMQKLTKEKYLAQPHTSSGRVPTDKAYRFFVDRIFSLSNAFNKKGLDFFQEIEQEIEDSLRFIRALTKNLASASSGLVVSYLAENNFLWKEGWNDIFQEPEFEDSSFSRQFIEMVEELEQGMQSLISKDFSSPTVYIGKENPISDFKDFSIIISRCSFPERQKGILMILGPKRMSYQKNVGLINSVTEFLERY